MDNENYELTARLHHTTGALNFSLEVFGNEIAKKHKYKENRGIDAIRFYLMDKYGWLPREVNSLSLDDMRFALSEEMAGWVLPKNARHAYPD